MHVWEEFPDLEVESMGFFDDLGKQAAKLANTAASKSAEMIEISKMKLAVKNEENKIDELYLEIGAAIYNRCSIDGDVPDDVKDFCIEVYNRKQTIEELNAKIQHLKKRDAENNGDDWQTVTPEAAPAAEEEPKNRTEFTISIKKEEE